ncbi:peptidylprolyl isomerase [Reichenbachiella versicolor]|uniref:peptidylprolyl isomerase n=1 Tax=Reichenbachiella versicolor TaxID=1821036 RepID=UPI000D6E0166|nr:peptidylprolyl isomerase [Reichenbachiella versicolor]
MALINTLREKGSKVLVGMIGVSILAFIVGDFFNSGSALFGKGDNVGEIAGEKVSYKDFIAKQEEMTYNFVQNNRGQSPTAAQQVFIRNQTWEALIGELAFDQQFSSIGLEVTPEEVIDMVQGDNISPQIRQAFTNPETGEFSIDNVITFLSNLSNQPPAQQASWYNFEQSLAPTRLREKYNNMLVKSTFASIEEAKELYKNTTATAEVNYIYVPYYSVPDSSVTVTDAELKSYLSDNREEYEKEETKEIKYVSFDVIASSADTAMVKEEIVQLKAELAVSTTDSLFATVNSEGTDPFKNYTLENLPEAVQVDGNILAVGEVTDPVIESGFYTIYKVVSVEESEDYSAKASHILFKWDDETSTAKAAAKKEARDILRQIKNGADFAEMARVHGTDGTASRGGDLGWFAQGKQMVKEFDDAVFARSSEGLLPDVVETQFGYHIIDVTAAKTNQSYDIAKVSLEIFISDETRNEVYRQAETFAMGAKSLEDLETSAKEQGLTVSTASNIGKNDRRLNSISEGRNIVFWAYNKANVGDVSDVFEIDNTYVIAAVADEQEKGVANLESVRFEIEKKVKDQKKADIIIEKLKAVDGALAQMAIDYEGNNAKYYSMPSLKLTSNSLQSVGLAPEAVGTIFSMESGERTQPFAISNGVILIELVSKLEGPEISDYVPYQNQITQKIQPRTNAKVDNAVKELADIEDNRYKFF